MAFCEHRPGEVSPSWSACPRAGSLVLRVQRVRPRVVKTYCGQAAHWRQPFPGHLAQSQAMRVRLPGTVEQGWAQVPRAQVERAVQQSQPLPACLMRVRLPRTVELGWTQVGLAARQPRPFPAWLTRVRTPGLPEPLWAEIAQAQADLAALPQSHSGSSP